jgi:aspartate kinase
MDMMVSTGEQVSVALLAMGIQDQGEKAISFNGWQVGIRTTA